MLNLMAQFSLYVRKGGLKPHLFLTLKRHNQAKIIIFILAPWYVQFWSKVFKMSHRLELRISF